MLTQIRKPIESEIERAKTSIYEDRAADFGGGYVGDFSYYLTSPERKEFTKAVMNLDDAEIGRLFRLGFDRGALKNIDVDAQDLAQQWLEFGETA